MSASDPPKSDSRLFERVELAFPELVGGFEVLERELEFDGRPVADLLAYSQGRFLLISLVDGSTDAAVLRALDGLAFAGSQSEILTAALPPGAQAEGGVRVVLVSLNGFATRQLERLGFLSDQGLWLLRRRELRTKRGTHTRLETIDVGDGRDSSRKPADLPSWALSEPYSSFLAQVAPDRLELATTLLGRLRGIDSTFGWGLRDGKLLCQVGELELCTVAWVDGHLELMGDENAPARPVRDQAAIDRYVDGILAEYLRYLSPMPTVPRTDGRPEFSPPVVIPAPVQAAVSEGESVSAPSKGADEREENLDQIDLFPVQPGPLLTREEIEAFQD